MYMSLTYCDIKSIMQESPFCVFLPTFGTFMQKKIKNKESWKSQKAAKLKLYLAIEYIAFQYDTWTKQYLNPRLLTFYFDSQTR